MPASAPAREVTNSHRSYRVAWETPRRWEPGRKGKFARVNDGFRTRDAVSAGRVPCVTQRAVRRPSLRGPLPPSAGGSGGPSSPRPHCRGARAPRGPLSGTGERPPGTAEIPRPALEIGLMGTTGRSHRRQGVCQCVTLCHAKTPSTEKHHPVGRVQTCVIFLQHTRPPALPTAPPAHAHLHGLQDDLEKENKKMFTAVEEHSKTRRHRRGFRVSAKPGLARGPLLGGELTGGFSRP